EYEITRRVIGEVDTLGSKTFCVGWHATSITLDGREFFSSGKTSDFEIESTEDGFSYFTTTDAMLVVCVSDISVALRAANGFGDANFAGHSLITRSGRENSVRGITATPSSAPSSPLPPVTVGERVPQF